MSARRPTASDGFRLRCPSRLGAPVAALYLALALAVSPALPVHAAPLTVSLPEDRILRPDNDRMVGVVVLISDANGWDAVEQGALEAVANRGAIGIGVDLNSYRAALSREAERDCLFLPADIERLTRYLHRRHQADFYRPPRIIGLGEGGALALAIAAQTPNGSFAETIGETLAVDPTEAIALPKGLCTPAPKRETGLGTVHGLSPGKLPNPVRIILSTAAAAPGRAHAAALKATHAEVQVLDGDAGPARQLTSEAIALVERLTPDDAALDLPLIEDLATPTRDTLAIFYSGDGGWREIDQRVASRLREGGVPVIGVDALRYFWSEKSPQDTAEDLSRIIATYRARLGVTRVVLVGYSFGANVLPRVYGLLPEEDRRSIDLLSLLALSRQADFEIDVTGWIGMTGAGKHGDPVAHLSAVEPRKVQCLYGLDETDSGCTALAPRVADGLQLIARPGGHHFDGNYERLADEILARIGAR